MILSCFWSLLKHCTPDITTFFFYSNNETSLMLFLNKLSYFYWFVIYIFTYNYIFNVLREIAIVLWIIYISSKIHASKEFLNEMHEEARPLEADWATQWSLQKSGSRCHLSNRVPPPGTKSVNTFIMDFTTSEWWNMNVCCL